MERHIRPLVALRCGLCFLGLIGPFRVCSGQTQADIPHPWRPAPVADTVVQRFPPSSGYARAVVPGATFAAWLRRLPLLPGKPAVRLFDGSLKSNQAAHAAVFDVDVGVRDLQQCADAVIRLRAEYLRAAGAESQICFRFTDGTDAVWLDWRDGYRPRARDKQMVFAPGSKKDASYQSFRKYLDVVFSYAGSMSLHKELQRVTDPKRVEPGDVFIKGGFPGHAVIVVDVVTRADGDRMFLLAQSYMPAQQVHVLNNPRSQHAWYRTSVDGSLTTPEWVFPAGSLHRFPERKCSSARRTL